MLEPLDRDTLCKNDRIASATLSTMARRLQHRDPGMLGAYAEHLVAESIGGFVVGGGDSQPFVSELGWGPIDVIWNRVADDGTNTEIGIQVKMAGLHHVFKKGMSKKVGFATKPSKHIFQKAATASRAAVWVLALHTQDKYDRGWRFFVVPGKYLARLGTSSVALNTLVLRVGHPVESTALGPLIAAAFDNPEGAADPSIWNCPKCEHNYPELGRLIAHQAAAGHKWSSEDLMGTVHLTTDTEQLELNGIKYRPVRYGEETVDGHPTFSQPCHICACRPGEPHEPGCAMGAGLSYLRPDFCRDCLTPVGAFHVGGCGIEECPACGGQFHTCECDETVDGVVVEDDNPEADE